MCWMLIYLMKLFRLHSIQIYLLENATVWLLSLFNTIFYLYSLSVFQISYDLWLWRCCLLVPNYLRNDVTDCLTHCVLVLFIIDSYKLTQIKEKGKFVRYYIGCGGAELLVPLATCAWYRTCWMQITQAIHSILLC